jgi:FkbM family methyltransferase
MADGVGGEGKVLAVEPNPRLAGLLRRNVVVNGFSRTAALLEKAIAEANAGKVSFVVPEGHRSMNGTLCIEAAEGDRVYEVETVTLDDAIAEWPRVDLIKIDAEGAEYRIWPGMRRTLERNRDVTVVMEVNSVKYRDPHAFVRAITDAGFRLRYIDDDAEIRAISAAELIADLSGRDRMLFLRRD